MRQSTPKIISNGSAATRKSTHFYPSIGPRCSRSTFNINVYPEADTSMEDIKNIDVRQFPKDRSLFSIKLKQFPIGVLNPLFTGLRNCLPDLEEFHHRAGYMPPMNRPRRFFAVSSSASGKFAQPSGSIPRCSDGARARGGATVLGYQSFEKLHDPLFAA